MAKIMIGEYEGTIYSEGGGWTGAIDLGSSANGKHRRVKRKGRTKTQVKGKLGEAVADLEAGARNSSDQSGRRDLNPRPLDPQSAT